MDFAKILASVGLAPKTLPQATTSLATAAESLNAVNALFANAGLNLETMLAAGPDALKAHIEGVSAKDGELAAAQAKVTDLEAKVATLTTEASAANAKFSAVGSALAPLGITATTKPEDFAGLISAHVKKEAALELAKGGHAPVTHVEPPAPKGAEKPIDPKLTGYDRYKADFERQAAALARK